jgi:ssDNA-binding Zn-finger/Zn-ribbon topoisomerase 1
MKWLHGEPAAQSTTQNGAFWFCNQNPSCQFLCSADESYLYEKAIVVWRATNQHPRCDEHSKLVTMYQDVSFVKPVSNKPTEKLEEHYVTDEFINYFANSLNI